MEAKLIKLLEKLRNMEGLRVPSCDLDLLNQSFKDSADPCRFLEGSDTQNRAKSHRELLAYGIEMLSGKTISAINADNLSLEIETVTLEVAEAEENFIEVKRNKRPGSIAYAGAERRLEKAIERLNKLTISKKEMVETKEIIDNTEVIIVSESETLQTVSLETQMQEWEEECKFNDTMPCNNLIKTKK